MADEFASMQTHNVERECGLGKVSALPALHISLEAASRHIERYERLGNTDQGTRGQAAAILNEAIKIYSHRQLP